MIRAKLIDHNPDSKYVDFREVPLLDATDYRCHPEGLIAFEEAARLARQLHDGDIEGYVGRYRWYRQALSGRQWHETTQPLP
jgi:hypothetical protein